MGSNYIYFRDVHNEAFPKFEVISSGPDASRDVFVDLTGEIQHH